MSVKKFDGSLVLPFVRGYFGADAVCERTKSGVSSCVYRVRHADKTYYLRVLPPDDGHHASEEFAHAEMRKRGLNVPEPLYFERYNESANASLFLTGEIPGRCLDDENDGEIGDVLRSAGRQLAVANSICVDNFGWIDREGGAVLSGEHDTFRAFYYDSLYRDIDKLARFGFDTDELKSLADHGFGLLDTDESCFTHGDFDDSHIYHLNGCFTGVIDFGDMCGSHVLHDLGHYKLHCPENFGLLAQGYSEVRPLSAADYVRIDFLALFVAISRSKYKYYKEMLRKQLEIVRKII